ncbi:MAG TPA: hypothetical protein VFR78_12310 [Pyrinomonadaceae bacterium]|nr:hypothetical protein [Pyrinomonadaceae bacterium]
MKRILNSTVITLVAFLLLGSLPVMAVSRPFALNGKGSGTFILDGSGNLIGADVTSTSNATHLGLCTTVGRVNYTPANDPEHPGRLLSSGSGTITAANGDVLYIEFNGVLDPPPPGSATGIDTPTFRFVGGTGRFAGASGRAEAVVIVNLGTGAFEITMVGNLDY